MFLVQSSNQNLNCRVVKVAKAEVCTTMIYKAWKLDCKNEKALSWPVWRSLQAFPMRLRNSLLLTASVYSQVVANDESTPRRDFISDNSKMKHETSEFFQSTNPLGYLTFWTVCTLFHNLSCPSLLYVNKLPLHYASYTQVAPSSIGIYILLCSETDYLRRTRREKYIYAQTWLWNQMMTNQHNVRQISRNENSKMSHLPPA